MEYQKLLSKEVQRFILLHQNDDAVKILLSTKTILGVAASSIVNQISGRKKSKEKLPSYYAAERIIYPPSLSLEQSSSEVTARYKATLLKDQKVIIDLTGGFGVDSLFFGKSADAVHYIEPDPELLDIARHNHQQLGVANITYHNSKAESFLEKFNERAGAIYLDPSRRTTGNKKVIRLKDYSPDVIPLVPSLFSIANSILIKCSPLLDIKAGISELGFVKIIHVLAVDNECKELLFELTPERNLDPVIKTVNFSSGEKSDELLAFKLSDEKDAPVQFSDPETFIYEPNAAILKAGAFKSMASNYSFKKISPNTHLYTSQDYQADFPGRIFKILNITPLKKANLIAYFPEQRANVICRNYPLNPESLKKKLKLKDGGARYLIAFSGVRKKFLIAAGRLK